MPFVSTVTGSFFAGRRSTAYSSAAWDPSTDISPAIWLDASDSGYYLLNVPGGQTVTGVADKAANAVVTVTGLPDISNTLNGKTVFTFTSGEDLTTNEVAQVSSGNHWAIGVFQWNTVDNTRDSFWSTENNTVSASSKRDYAISAGNASTFNGELDLDGLSSNRISSSIGDKEDFNSPGAVPQNTWTIIAVFFNKTGNQIGVKVNGTSLFTVNGYDNSLNTNLDLRIMRNRGGVRMEGQMAEFFTVADVPGTGGTDTSTLIKAEGYLAHKWGLTSNLPVSHTYKTSAP
jgi:hypothetical protein